jgi:hypothetical protein
MTATERIEAKLDQIEEELRMEVPADYLRTTHERNVLPLVRALRNLLPYSLQAHLRIADILESK